MPNRRIEFPLTVVMSIVLALGAGAACAQNREGGQSPTYSKEQIEAMNAKISAMNALILRSEAGSNFSAYVPDLLKHSGVCRGRCATSRWSARVRHEVPSLRSGARSAHLERKTPWDS